MSPHIHDEPATPMRRAPADWRSLFLDPAPARVDDRLRGGIDNYDVDRKLLAGLGAAAIGELSDAVRASDRHTASVAEQAARQGIRQALVLGAGLPIVRSACPEVHEVFARHHGWDAGVVYVTDDSLVWGQLRMMSDVPPVCADIVLGDSRHIETLLSSPHISPTFLDPGLPIVVFLPGTLAWMSDRQARHVIATLLGWLPPGSVLTLTHPITSQATRALSLRWESAGLHWQPRTHDAVDALFCAAGFAGTVVASGLATATHTV
ncbi:SAM-dependent methyltransferase [Streptomyces sp. SM12]|uniref:SAM-dependent methyltransferase n=1 Tax=Streptomyces sp. SM12 TaxID=1071602 RepID=UPI000CD5451C|nr:SAM-dependent methyltransferase [Streptomyces sp. SM12]